MYTCRQISMSYISKPQTNIAMRYDITVLKSQANIAIRYDISSPTEILPARCARIGHL